MNLKKQLATKNECYIRGDKIKPIGIVVHSTGANNPALKRYVQPDDGLLGKNIYNNSWNNYRPGGRQICCHAFIGKLQSGAIATYQILPWETRGWHAGSGKKGSANNGYIGFEICEDNTQNESYAKQTYQEAVEFCAHLVKLYPAIKYENIIGHNEAAAKGIASNHGDPEHWWRKFGLSMAQFRKDVKKKVEDNMADKTRFSDVPKSHWAYDEIENLAKKGIISGFSGTKLFKPNLPLSRQQAAKMIALSAGLVASNLIDLDKSNAYPNEYIIALERAGVIGGYSTDKGKEFRPLDNTKRAHLAKMVVLAFKLKKGSKVINFDDKTNEQDQEYIDILASLGIVDGYEENGKKLFKPYTDVTRAQAAKIIDLAMKIK